MIEEPEEVEQVSGAKEEKVEEPLPDSQTSSVEPWMFTNVFGTTFESATTVFTTEKWQNMCLWT